MLKQTSPTALPSQPIPVPEKPVPSSKTKMPVEKLIEWLFFISTACLKYNSWVKAKRFKHGFAQHMKKVSNRQVSSFSFEDRLWLK